MFVLPEELKKVAETNKCTKCSRIFQLVSSKNRHDRLTCKYRENANSDVRPNKSESSNDRDIEMTPNEENEFDEEHSQWSNESINIEQQLLSNDLDIEMLPNEFREDLDVRPEESQLSNDFAITPDNQWCNENLVPDKNQQSHTADSLGLCQYIDSIVNDLESSSNEIDLSIVPNNDQAVIELEVYFLHRLSIIHLLFKFGML